MVSVPTDFVLTSQSLNPWQAKLSFSSVEHRLALPSLPLPLPSFLQAKITPSPCAHAPPPPPEALWVPSTCKRPPSALPPSHRMLQFFSSLPNVRPPVAFLPLTADSPSSSPWVVHLPESSANVRLYALSAFGSLSAHLVIESPPCFQTAGTGGSMPGTLARELAVRHLPPGRVVLPLHPCSRPHRAWSDMPLQTQTPLDKLCQMPHSSSPLTGGREGVLEREGASGRSTAQTDVPKSQPALPLLALGDPQQPYCIPGSPSQHPCSWTTLSASGLGFGNLCHLLGSKVKVGWEPWPTLY